MYAESLGLALHRDGVDGGNLYAEHCLDRFCDLGLGGAAHYLENILFLIHHIHTGFADDRLYDDAGI